MLNEYIITRGWQTMLTGQWPRKMCSQPQIMLCYLFICAFYLRMLYKHCIENLNMSQVNHFVSINIWIIQRLIALDFDL